MNRQDKKRAESISCEFDDALRYALGTIMSEISEAGICAGWLSGLEDDLPPIIKATAETNESQVFYQALITPKEARMILAIVSYLGHWVKAEYPVNGPRRFVPYVPEEDE
jgi:hypothetical protein